MNSKLYQNFSKYIHLYLINGFLAVFLATLIVNVSVKATAKEKVSIFIGSYTCEVTSLKSYLYAQDHGDIKEIEINHYSTTDDYYKYYLNLQVRTSDIIIVQASDITRMNFDYFVEFDEELSSSLGITSNPFYQHENKKYGLCLSSKNEGTLYLSDYIKYQKDDVILDEREDFYLFINSKSNHVGAYGDKSIDDAAITILRALVNA